MSTDYRIPSDWYTTVFEREIKGRLYFLIVVLGIAFLVAIGQSKLFFSSIWVIVEFGFNYWAKYIHHMFNNFYWWAIISGIFAAIGSFIGSKTTDLKKILIGTSISFGVGFTITYLLVIIVTIFLYIPLGIFSFVFPDQIHFLSIGFAFLCSTYIVFTIIAVDTPLFLLEVIKKAPLYYKILAVLFGLLLVSKSLSMLLSILQILIEYSIWRVHLAAFIIAFGGSLLFSVFINLKQFKHETKYVKIAGIVIVYIFSIVVGNLSEKIFHWGEYWAAFVSAILCPIVFSFILHKITKSIISVISIIAGGICGFGAGIIFANQIGLGIIGQDWFGVICGAAIALGISISLGFMIAPRIAELVTNVFRFRLKIGLLVGTGFVVGIIAGIMIVGFMNR